jgi:site-specific recombinase XerD
MATRKFYLKEENKKGLSLILLLYQDKGRKFKFSTGLTINKQFWDGKKIIGKTLEVFDNNKKLEDVYSYLDEIERESLVNNTYYNIDVVENKFRAKYKKQIASSTETEFFTLYDEFVQISKVTKTNSTIGAFNCTKSKLKKYEVFKKSILTFETINKAFYNSFVSFLISECGHLNNSVGKYIKNLKTFLNYVKDNELINTSLNLKGFKILREDIDIIALTQEELSKIYYVKDLPEYLDFVKDQFCFECFTGIRFSDICRLRNENHKGDYLEFRTLKTKDSLIVPLNMFAKEIIEKYKGRFIDRPLPPAISNQKTNDYIKDIAEIAEVTDFMLIEKFSGSKRIEIRKPKCDLISTHTGRKSFITLSYENGMPTEMIMKITGIKKWETLKKYLKVSEKAKLLKMNECWNKEVMQAM